MSTTVCNANGGLGCVRGFIREKCRRCYLGSVACEVCHSSGMHSGQHRNSRLGLHHTHWSSSASLPSSPMTSSVSSSHATLPMPSDASLVTRNDTLSISSSSTPSTQPAAHTAGTVSYQEEPFPVGFGPSQCQAAVPAACTALSRRASLTVKSPSVTHHTFTKPFSKSEPSSPTIASRPTAPTFCGFCTGGRRVCEECFGLGYVQRVCQSCLRDQHRLHARKPSLPASMHQLGTRLKERFSHHSSTSTEPSSVSSLQRRSTSTSTSTSASDTTSSSRSSTMDQGTKQLQPQPQQQPQQQQLLSSSSNRSQDNKIRNVQVRYLIHTPEPPHPSTPQQISGPVSDKRQEDWRKEQRGYGSSTA